MNCERAKELFSEVLEDSTASDVTAVRGHVDECASCRREFDLFRQTWYMLGTLPEVEPPSGFRHDVVMRVARAEHERTRRAKHGAFGLGWDFLFGRLVPAHAIAIACAGAALAVILLKCPESAYEHFAGMFNPGVQIGESTATQRPANAIEASPLSMQSERKREWQLRKLGRNTVWVAIDPKDNGDGTTLYRLMLSINPDALLPDETTARIGARIFVLPPNQFDAAKTVESADPEWQGSILADSPVLVPVIVDQSQGRTGSVNLLIAWQFRHRDFAYTVFIPTQTSASSARDVFDFSVDRADFRPVGASLYSTLQSVARDYGVPIIANAYLTEKRPVVSFAEDSLDQALMQVLKPIGLDWLYADKAIYVDRKYDVKAVD